MAMTPSSEANFKHVYQTHLNRLKLDGLQPKTIEAYARAIRRIGAYFDHRIEGLCEQQLTEYFTDLLASHSWSAVKLDLYGLKFFYAHGLRKPWVSVDLIKPPKAQRLPDIVTVEEAGRRFAATRVLSYRVFYCTVYSFSSARNRRPAVPAHPRRRRNCAGCVWRSSSCGLRGTS